jgi:cytochrome c
MPIHRLLASALLLGPAPLLAQAAPNPTLGRMQFGQCSVCHAVAKDKPDGIGPNLWGVVGAKAATRRPRYAYSPQLKASKLTWDEATLDRWIASPGATVKGNKMEFIGIGRKQVRANIIAYLASLK